MSANIPSVFRLTGKNTIIPVEFGINARPFERAVLCGRHWGVSESTPGGTIRLTKECAGPLKINPLMSHDGKEIIGYDVWCHKCGDLTMNIPQKSHSKTRENFNKSMVRLIRETILAMYRDNLYEMTEFHGNIHTRFVSDESNMQTQKYPIGCLPLRSDLEESVYLGLVPCPELALQGIAATEYSYHQFMETTRQASDTIGDHARSMKERAMLFF